MEEVNFRLWHAENAAKIPQKIRFCAKIIKILKLQRAYNKKALILQRSAYII
jgi:hypothetical protein